MGLTDPRCRHSFVLKTGALLSTGQTVKTSRDISLLSFMEGTLCSTRFSILMVITVFMEMLRRVHLLQSDDHELWIIVNK